MYYKSHDVKPEVICEITSISYNENDTLSLRNGDYNQEEIEMFKTSFVMTDEEMNDFLNNKDNYYVFYLECGASNESEYTVDMLYAKCKNNKYFWVDDTTFNYGFNVLTLGEDDTGGGLIIILVKDIDPYDDDTNDKIISMLKNSDLKVFYEKVFGEIERFFAPHITYYTDVIVK